MSILGDDNRIDVKGNNNIIAQSIKLDNNSQLHINNIDIGQIINELKKWYTSNFDEVINIIIITTSINRIENTSFDNETFRVLYGNELKDWKPFNNKYISEIIEYFIGTTNLRANIQCYVIDCLSEITDEKTWAYLKLLRNNSIIIVDCIAISFIENQKIAKIFDDYAIGGCLIPIYPNQKSELENNLLKIKIETFKHLYIYLNEFPEEGFENIELDRIFSETDLIRAISIASRHLSNRKFKIIGSRNLSLPIPDLMKLYGTT